MTLTPIDIGLPSRFTSFRNLSEGVDQFDLAYEIATSSTRFNLLGAPPGSGKTIINIAAALLQDEDARILYLVSTNQLLRQVQDEFESIGITPIMGAGNYPCRDATSSTMRRTTMCNDGKCLSGYQCDYRDDGCDYYDAVRAAKDARLDLSNFAYRASLAKWSNPDAIGKFDFIICDEAHLLLDWMSDFCTVELDSREYSKLGIYLPETYSIIDWSRWMEAHLDDISRACKDQAVFASVRDARKLKQLESDAKLIADIEQYDSWSLEKWRYGVRITPVEPGQFLNQYTYLDALRILLCSASITKSDASSFNCGKDYTFFQGGTGFPVRNRPLIWVPTCKVSYNMPESRLRLWMLQIDSLIDLTQGYSGIIHSVSYDRMRYIHDNSRHKTIIHRSNTSRSQQLPTIWEALEEFYAIPGSILVSPVVGTGYDFKHDLARWQIIAKVPFLNPTSPIVKARTRLWKSKYKLNYLTLMAAKAVLQMYGRIVRAEDDWGVTWVIDDAWQYVSKSPAISMWVKNAMSTCWDGLPSKVEVP